LVFSSLLNKQIIFSMLVHGFIVTSVGLNFKPFL